MAASDRPAVAGLLQQLNDFERAIGSPRVEGIDGGMACLEEDQEAVAANGGAMLVAEAGGRVVAFLCLVFEPGKACVPAPLRRHAYVADLVVEDGGRRGGIGTALLAEAESLARAAGIRVMSIGVLVANEGARRAYERFGFWNQSLEMLKLLD